MGKEENFAISIVAPDHIPEEKKDLLPKGGRSKTGEYLVAT
jgi:hypothetical protein